MEQQNTKKPIIFSGIQPTGVFTLGNYLGAIRNWQALQEDYRCIFSVVDLHAITVRQDSAQLRRRTLESVALLLACGIDPQKSVLFLQSHNPAHAELSWVLSCYTQFGELSRMTQFKDKSQRHADNINAGLFTYPVLMAADILLYRADMVPVGQDQKQHLELARNVAERFNGLYGNVFTVPEPYMPTVSARVMSLADPTKKMSKSDENPNGFISLLDDRDTVIRKFRRAVTDSDTVVRYAEDKPGICNLMSIYSAMTGRDFASIEREFEGKGYGDFKLAVGECVADKLEPIHREFDRLSGDKAYLLQVCSDGARAAIGLSRRTLEKVYHKVGFVKSEL